MSRKKWFNDGIVYKIHKNPEQNEMFYVIKYNKCTFTKSIKISTQISSTEIASTEKLISPNNNFTRCSKYTIQKQNKLSYATEEEDNIDNDDNGDDDDDLEIVYSPPKCQDSDLKMVDYTIHAIVNDIMSKKLKSYEIVEKIEFQQSFYDEGKGILKIFI